MYNVLRKLLSEIRHVDVADMPSDEFKCTFQLGFPRLAGNLAAAAHELGVSSQVVTNTSIPSLLSTSSYISSAMPESEPHTTRDETQRKCSTCNIVFQRTTHLRRHMLTHTQDKRFACSQCGKSFVRRFVISLLMPCYHQRFYSSGCTLSLL